VDYEKVAVGDRIYLQPKQDSGRSTLLPTAIQSLSVRDSPIGFCVKIELGSVTSIGRRLYRYGGAEDNRLPPESVECNHKQSPADLQVMLLEVYPE
jgi:hypothetical protein